MIQYIFLIFAGIIMGISSTRVITSFKQDDNYDFPSFVIIIGDLILTFLYFVK